jgi:alpha-amylase/alpha-mannosidase (GH57 family)
MKPLIIHGHFYQPPRENPWTGLVDEEASAAPFHDWNERVNAECYRPNSMVSVIDDQGVGQTFNNYSLISFDFGPTLLSWLEREDFRTYTKIIDADIDSARNHDGHGNAIAHAYGHAILPLCNAHDLKTQVRWGLADFRYRFGRDAEALWLPETACNDDVLGVLIDEELRFVILAPQQAARVRTLPGDLNEEWRSVAGGEVDTTIPYHYFHRDGSGRSIAVFFYDQQVAGAIAFNHALNSSGELLQRLTDAGTGNGKLVNVATDGESYGHHHKFGELCLTYALGVEAAARGFSVTNYGEHLDRNPPAAEVEIYLGVNGGGSSWSCTHGVERWQADCGCATNSEATWNQAWRAPLRRALDFLRDDAAQHFERTRGILFADPWEARDASVELILNAHASREQFLDRFASRILDPDEQMRALLFLEMQRNTVLMYASCGWFFSDISGIEPIQILKYACRAIELMDQLGLPSPRERFLELLDEAKSNRVELGTGADIYRKLVEPLRQSISVV